MPDTFNLIDEPFIPCRMADGTTQLLNLRDALARAHEVAEIADSSPLTTFALYRFLLVLVHRCLDADDWTADRLPMEKIDKYLTERKDHFDLFDAKRPFLQNAKVDSGVKLSPITNLMAELPAGTNINHARHTFDADSALCARCCVYGLLRLPPFCPAGGAGAKDSDGNTLPGKSTSINGDAPTYFFPLGSNLLSTLRINSAVLMATPGDRPSWEDGTAYPSEIGCLEGLTWQPRNVLLTRASSSAGRCTSCGAESHPSLSLMYFQNGRDGGDSRKAHWVDPHVAYRQSVPAQNSNRKSNKKSMAKRDCLKTNEPNKKQVVLLARGRWLSQSWQAVIAGILESFQDGEGKWGCRALSVTRARDTTAPSPLTVFCVQSYVRPGKDKTTHQAEARWHITDANATSCNAYGNELRWLESCTQHWEKSREVALNRKSRTAQFVPPELIDVAEFERRAEAHFRRLLAGAIDAIVFRTRVRDDLVELTTPPPDPARPLVVGNARILTARAVHNAFPLTEVPT